MKETTGTVGQAGGVGEQFVQLQQEEPLSVRERLALARLQFWRAGRQLPREGKHSQGSRGGSKYRKRLRASRKRERQARRYARLCRQGKKHRI